MPIERLKKRMKNERLMKSVTLRIPVDVMESVKEVATNKGFSGYQALLKTYINEGLRKDKEQYCGISTARLIEALKNRGVPKRIIEEATWDLIDSSICRYENES